MRYLLDTSAVLAHYRKEAGWEAVQAVFESDDAEITLASVSLPEFGRRLRDLGASDAEVGEALTGYRLLCGDVVPIDTDVALAAYGIGVRAPQRLPLVDALIAAAAQAREAVLVHRDAHMRGIPGDVVQQRDLSDASRPN